MAKFLGAGVIWNPETEKPLCRFENGELETNDKAVIAILRKKGFKEAEEEKADSWQSLLKQAKQLGIETHGKKKDVILAELEKMKAEG